MSVMDFTWIYWKAEQFCFCYYIERQESPLLEVHHKDSALLKVCKENTQWTFSPEGETHNEKPKYPQVITSFCPLINL